jgi:hypothetical protein
MPSIRREFRAIERIRQLLVRMAGQASKRDLESAAITEGELRNFALTEIADGCDSPAELAAEALKSADVPFPRWGKDWL